MFLTVSLCGGIMNVYAIVFVVFPDIRKIASFYNRGSQNENQLRMGTQWQR